MISKTIRCFRLASFHLILILLPLLAHAGTDLKHLRAVHAMGNWGGNVLGFVKPVLTDAPTLSAQQINVQSLVSSYLDAQGVKHTNDATQVKLSNVTLGSDAPLKVAGFRAHRDIDTGIQILQFLPKIDTNLSGIDGFSGDVNIIIPTDGKVPYLGDLNTLSGTARKLVLAVLAHSPEFLQGASYTLDPGAVFGSQASLTSALANLRTTLNATDKTYFDYLKSINVEWIGISVAMHYDSFSNPIIATHTCATGGMLDSGGNYTSCAFRDEDLSSFINRAKANGFKIYLTLAFESSQDLDSTASPACGTPNYKMSRWLLGQPQLPTGSISAQCIAAADWWWNPYHPQHTTKVAQFWNSYQQIAVRYAALAQQLGVDLYSLGTETDNLFRTRVGSNPLYSNHFKSQLLAMVAAVRNVYSGVLTYDQSSGALAHPDWTGGGADSTQYLFNDLNLDAVGVSAYFQLVGTPPQRLLSVAELETQWENIFSTYLAPLQARNPGKPIIFTEVGYTDDINSPYNEQSNAGKAEPTFDDSHPTIGMQQQQNIYQSFFNVNARHGDLVAGTFFWGNDYFPYNDQSCKNIDWSVVCHPARKVLASSYQAWLNKDVDRVFNWAEATLPQYFPSGAQSISSAGYYLRYYPTTGNYLVFKDNRLIVHNGQKWNLMDVGGLRTYLDMAGVAGF